MITRSEVPAGATSGAVQTDAPTPRNHTSKTNKSTAKGGARSVATLTAVEPMTAGEQSALTLLEQVIEKGLHTFLDVGNALLRIRDERLYRGTHSAFDAYCRERWGFSKTQANRFIAASTVAKNLAPIGVTPTSESQVRLLASFKPAQQVKVFERAAKVSGGVEKVTAAAITDAARKMHLIEKPQASADSRSDNTVDRKAVVDAISDWADAHWEKASQLSVAEFVKQIKGVINKL